LVRGAEEFRKMQRRGRKEAAPKESGLRF